MRSVASTRCAACKCRTTWHAGLFNADDLFALADTQADAGVAHCVLQECQHAGYVYVGIDGRVGGAAGVRGRPATVLGQASVSDGSRLIAAARNVRDEGPL